MNVLALVIGLTISLFIVYRFKKMGLQKSRWAYPILIGSFPLYYFGFALYSRDYKVVFYEFCVGLIFFILAYVSYKIKKTSAFLILGLLSIFHALYDYFHIHLFLNKGTPSWWIEFCGSIDICIGVYLLFLAFNYKKP